MTLLLTRRDVVELLSLDECISAVEEAFRAHGDGRAAPPAIATVPAPGGAFHIKAAFLEIEGRPFFAAKTNANFSANPLRYGLPAIQGTIVLCDGEKGSPLALLDSIEITIQRTGAATAVAAKYLARPDSKVVTICGCGNQGRVQLRAIKRVLPIERVFAFDNDPEQSRIFADEMSAELKIDIEPTHDLSAAVRRSDVCVTCTPSRSFLVAASDVVPGTFLAAVGADHESKQELDPQLLASNKVVVDIVGQCAQIGDLHHAIDQGLMKADDVYAELGEVVAGKKPGRQNQEEIIVFDSTGMALQDVAAAALVYRKAIAAGRGTTIEIAG